MKIQEQHIGNYSYQIGISNIFDYSPFGAPLDGRAIQNTFPLEGNTYSIEFYIINACNSSHFEVDYGMVTEGFTREQQKS